MPSFLTQLENNEAVLLMYLANELPAEDRAEVDVMLEQDEMLRAHLGRIRAAYAALDSALGKADQVSAMPSGFAAARAVGDVIRRANAAAVFTDEKVDLHPHRRRWILYPLAGAAAVALGMFLWWQNVSDQLNRPPEIPLTMNSRRWQTLAEWEMGINAAAPGDIAPDGSLEIEQELQLVTFLSQNLR